MDLRIYRQKATTLKDGLTVYSGEDARPYVDDRLIMVADGLGGTGAIRHPSINQGVLNRETVVNTFFNGVYADLDNELFANYVTNSFVELYELKDFFGKNPHALKKSSYFGSRLVLSIILHHFYNDEDLSTERIFADISTLDNYERSKYLNTLGEKVGIIIKEDLHRVANNANIFYESSIPRLKLLATTMCVTLFQEKDEYVEALYFIAGDSRPYFWNEKDGLCQITEDLEGEDGGMTSCVYEGGDFYISCKYFRFDKPCILFNASDGCFDSGKFKSQMAFEKLILDAIVKNNSVNDIETALIEDYDIYGTHDDSSSLALKSFGYVSESEIKEACERRLDFLNNKYLSKIDNLLTTDYLSEYQHIEKELKAKLSSVKEWFSSDSAVIEWCNRYVISGKYPPYLEAIQLLERQVDSKKEIIRKSKIRIIELVRRNYSRFILCVEKKSNWLLRRNIDNINDHWNKCERTSNDYISELERYRENLASSIDSIKGMLEKIYDIGVPESFEDYDDLNFELTEECEKTLGGLFDFFEDLKKKKVKLVKRLLDEREEYVRRNIALSEKNHEELKTICEMVFNGNISLDDVEIITFDKKAIADALYEIEKSKNTIDELQIERREDARRQALADFMNNEYASILLMVLNDESVSLDPQLKKEAVAVIDGYREKAKELKEKSEQQQRLFEEYELDYGKIMRGELYGI